MSRRFAATDLHGCLRTFRYLVEEELRLRPTDHLYLLGDYVNKGPDSGGVGRHNPGFHHLAALNLDSWELHLVENREEPYPINVR